MLYQHYNTLYKINNSISGVISLIICIICFVKYRFFYNIYIYIQTNTHIYIKVYYLVIQIINIDK